jgi:hypothetical protein
LKAWKNGAIWGFISFFGLFLVALGEEHGGPASIFTYIITLPATLTIKLMDNTFLTDTFYGLFILAPICSILVGALIGSIIENVNDKYIQWRSAK